MKETFSTNTVKKRVYYNFYLNWIAKLCCSLFFFFIVGSMDRVSLFVSLQVTRLWEGLLTVRAVKHLLPSVWPLVSIQVNRLWEGLLTLGTCISLLSAKSHFMFFRVPGSDKGFSQSEHLYPFSPLWVIVWFFRIPDREKDFPHCWQSYPFSPMWVFLCSFRQSDREKDFPQLGQSNGFSPVCDFRCVFMLA